MFLCFQLSASIQLVHVHLAVLKFGSTCCQEVQKGVSNSTQLIVCASTRVTVISFKPLKKISSITGLIAGAHTSQQAVWSLHCCAGTPQDDPVLPALNGGW